MADQQQIERVNAIIQTDPVLQQLSRRTNSFGTVGMSTKNMRAFHQRLQELGVTLPEGTTFTNRGGSTLVEPDHFVRDAIIGSAAVGGGMFLPALVGGSSAAGGAPSVAQVGGAITANAPAGVIGGGGGIAGLGGTGALIGKGADILGKLGRTGAAGAASAADGRLQEGRFNQGQDALAQSAARGNITADSERFRQAMLASLLSGAEDSNVTAPSHIASRVGTVSGGLRPSALAGRQDIASAIRPRLMQNLMTGNEIPGPTAAPSPGVMDKANSFLGTAGGYLDSLGGVQGLLNMFRKPTTPAPGPVTGTVGKVSFR